MYPKTWIYITMGKKQFMLKLNFDTEGSQKIYEDVGVEVSYKTKLYYKIRKTKSNI